ncbi:hypothetical protein PT974_09071 [Cladobotryum mycophilum]|uniref:Uncharacterized protein n=1 Tax=Cladobotryum mycophilum TaxID=491253 RepID=A0ABR0SF77_9HYPO
MKFEDTDSTAKGLASIPTRPSPEPTKPIPANVKWTPQDAICARLFGPWDNLPCHDYLDQTNLLRDLDRVIVAFEARIRHTDAGFRAWRGLHKRAMEAGLAEIPGFPSLRQIRDGKSVWQDDVWEKRYHYLVYQRHHMILARLNKLFVLSRREREDFFGDRPAPARATLKRRTRGPYSRPLGLRCDWWRPLDFLLERAARDWHMDKTELKSHFWMEEASTAPIKAEKAEPCEVVPEPQPTVELDMGKENIEPFELLDLSLMSVDLSQGTLPPLPVGGQMSW